MQTNTTPNTEPILTWTAKEHVEHKRTIVWYICAALFIGLCIAYSIWTQAWTFTFLTIVLSVLYFTLHKKEFPLKTIRLWRSGFAIGDTYNEWGECKGYWIVKGPDYYELHIEKNIGAEVKIQTGEIDPYLLHGLLPNLLPQLEGRKESTLDTIIRICKL